MCRTPRPLTCLCAWMPVLHMHVRKQGIAQVPPVRRRARGRARPPWLPQAGPGDACAVLRGAAGDLGLVQGPLRAGPYRDHAHHMMSCIWSCLNRSTLLSCLSEGGRPRAMELCQWCM